MGVFRELPGVCVVHRKGVYKQVPTALRDNELYAKVGGGYIRLRSNGETNGAAYRWDYIEDIDKYRIDAYGRFIHKG